MLYVQRVTHFWDGNQLQRKYYRHKGPQAVRLLQTDVNVIPTLILSFLNNP
jgi:hypothetical protein